ncbi:MAG: DEAD/DEAH box helicase family protein [Thiolinea sp.]
MRLNSQCREWLGIAQGRRPILLHGITGSGKTEIYLRLLRDILQRGRQVMTLVPEIGLTPPVTATFPAFFPDYPMAVLHSGLNDTERLEAWLQARSGRAHIIIGTRSAVFTPCPELGMIIIDEEHDLSFKAAGRLPLPWPRSGHQACPTVEYPGAAGKLRRHGILHNAEQGHFCYPARPTRCQPIACITGPGYPGPTAGRVCPTQSLQAIAGVLERSEQAIVFINRRGFAPVLLCNACGCAPNARPAVPT